MANTATIKRSVARDSRNCRREKPSARATARSMRPIRTDTNAWTVRVSSMAMPMAAMLKAVRPSQPPPASGLRPANSATASPSLTATSPGIVSRIWLMTCRRSASGSKDSHISPGRSRVLLGRRRAYSW